VTDVSTRPADQPRTPASAHAAPQSLSRPLLIAVAIVITFGTIVRVRQYAARPSFWRDEAFVVLNVRQLTATELTGKLRWDQAAPPLFLWTLRTMRAIAGESELALRFPALVCAILSLIVFALLARHTLPPPAAFLAVGLLTFDHRLVEYSTQVKQYSGDVLVAALILLTAFGRPESPPLRRLAATATVAAAAVWFSHTAAIVFGGVTLILTLQCLRTTPRHATRALLWNGLFALSFVAMYFVSIRRQHTDFLYQYWQNAFPDWRRPRGVLPWLGRQLFDLFQAPYRWAAPVLIPLAILAIPWATRRGRWELCTACFAILTLVILAALARQYPLDGSGRLSLFLMPEIYLLCGAGAAFVWELLSPRWLLAWWAVALAVLGTGLATSTRRLFQPTFQSHIRPAVQYVRDHRREGEALVLAGVPTTAGWQTGVNGRQLEALCYWPDPPAPIYLLLRSPREVLQNRFWVLAAFPPRDLKRLDPVLNQFRAIADEKERFTDDKGGVAILFERK
jgi:4-amino-4-deoxy-L-arabinose transferase-like glycosyltransferase